MKFIGKLILWLAIALLVVVIALYFCSDPLGFTSGQRG